ncbi:MAG: hydrogenase maturation nickel metallochaperone HypA [Acidobacteriota bacterium]|nr:MAG: hydrogenase maturation nickel metallochaperone HypA [Acidobacteriota bacterium]
MHELSIAISLVEQLERAARREGAERVTAVRLVVGGLSGVEREPLEFCFPMAARGTLLEGARLEIEEVPPRVRCPACGAEETGGPAPVAACPRCGAAPVEILGGRELRVREMEVV